MCNKNNKINLCEDLRTKITFSSKAKIGRATAVLPLGLRNPIRYHIRDVGIYPILTPARLCFICWPGDAVKAFRPLGSVDLLVG